MIKTDGIKVAVGQKWDYRRSDHVTGGHSMEIVYCGQANQYIIDDITFGIVVAIREELTKLIVHQSGHVFEDGFEYSEKDPGEETGTWRMYEHGKWYIPNIGGEHLYRRPIAEPTPAEKHCLVVGGLYKWLRCLTISEITSPTTIKHHYENGMKSHESDIGEESNFDDATLVSRDSEEAVRILGEVEKPIDGHHSGCGGCHHPDCDEHVIDPTLPTGWKRDGELYLAKIDWDSATHPKIQHDVDGLFRCDERGRIVTLGDIKLRIVEYRDRHTPVPTICGLGWRAEFAVLEREVTK